MTTIAELPPALRAALDALARAGGYEPIEAVLARTEWRRRGLAPYWLRD